MNICVGVLELEVWNAIESEGVVRPDMDEPCLFVHFEAFDPSWCVLELPKQLPSEEDVPALWVDLGLDCGFVMALVVQLEQNDSFNSADDEYVCALKKVSVRDEASPSVELGDQDGVLVEDVQT